MSTDPNADILTFSGTGGSPQQAVQLANAYADAYTRYRAALDGQPVTQALSTLAVRLQELRKAGETGSSTIYASLLAQQRQLLALEAVPTESAVVVARADAAPKTRPRLRIGLLVGLVVGLFLAIATALIREAVEKRPRSTEELPERLDLRVLGRIPTTYEGATGTVALTHPASVDAETYRLLRINFEHAAADGGKVFAVTSAIGREGKSTVAANLAVTLARAGRSVILIDCDPIRPVMRERFGLAPSAGLGELALGTATVSDVLSRVTLPRNRTGLRAARGPDSEEQRQRQPPRRASGEGCPLTAGTLHSQVQGDLAAGGRPPGRHVQPGRARACRLHRHDEARGGAQPAEA